MLMTGLALGLAVAVAFFLTRAFFVVHEGEAAILTSFGKPVGGSPAKIFGAGLHWKAIWHEVHRAPLAESVTPITYDDTRGVLAHDGTPLRVDASVRYRVVPSQIERYLFGVDHQEEHFTELFESQLRGTVATFSPTEQDSTAFARLRRDRRELSSELRRACEASLSDRYGIELNAVDLSGLSPPRELEEALNAVLQAGALARTELELASASCQQKVVAANEGVRIAEQKAKAAYDEMITLARFLVELKKAGTLKDYVHHRRSEILNQAKTVFVRSER